MSLIAIQPYMNLHAMESPSNFLSDDDMIQFQKPGMIVHDNLFYLNSNFYRYCQMSEFIIKNYDNSKNLVKNNSSCYNVLSKLFFYFTLTLRKANLNRTKKNYQEFKANIENAITYMKDIIEIQQKIYDLFITALEPVNTVRAREHINHYRYFLSLLEEILRLVVQDNRYYTQF